MKKTAKEKRFLSVLDNRTALLDGYKCPICKREFSDQNACSHGWGDVKNSNEDFLLSYISRIDL